ncbi:MAG: hypothetical protein ACE5HO_18685 [bacterium]
MQFVDKKTQYCFLLTIILAFTLGLFGCTSVKLIADYDEKVDQEVTALHRKMETFFVRLADIAGTPAGNYENHKEFYEQVKVDISALELRVAVQPKNEITLKQIKLLRDSVDKLEQIHKVGINSPEVVQPIRESFKTAFTAILKLEMAKKRGESI